MEPEHFKIVSKLPNYDLVTNGSCALCNEQYHYGNRVLAEYQESGGFILTEPFNLCDLCIQSYNSKKEYEKQFRV